MVKPYMDNINWTKGIDQKTGKPLDYDPNKDVQTYSGLANPEPLTSRSRRSVRRSDRRQQLLAVLLQPAHQAPLHPGADCLRRRDDRHGAVARTRTRAGSRGPAAAIRTAERYESNLTAVDPVTGEVKKSVQLRYPNYSGTLATGGGLVFLALMDGTIAAYDDTTLEELWKFNVGSGFSAPPMTFEVNGKQYRRDRVGAEPAARQARQHAGTQGAANFGRALCLRAVTVRA